MNPTQIPGGINFSQMIPDTQTLSFPKIDHILAHAKHPELSYLYARPEFQASAATSGPDDGENTKGGASGKKSKIKIPKKPAYEKKNPNKIRKSEIYEKYYIDENRQKKNTPVKKVKGLF
jgi:hypothetical protein